MSFGKERMIKRWEVLKQPSILDLKCYICDYETCISNFKKINCAKWAVEALTHDILQSPLPQKFNAIYSLDVLEHIPVELEKTYMSNICKSIEKNGCVIIGMPSLESQIYASAGSKEGHINCKSGKVLQEFLNEYFENVFIFSMNDEVIHTGFSKMAHYLMALCTTPKNK